MGGTSQPAPYRDDPDAVSLHTTPDDYTYDDAPESFGAPPSYADSEIESLSVAGNAPPAIHHIAPPTGRTDHSTYRLKNGNPVVCDTITTTDARADLDPVHLEETVRALARNLPTPYIYIMGTHRETVKKGDKKETKDVMDFRIVINIRRYLSKCFDDENSTAMHLFTSDNGEKTHRGTIMKCRAPGVKQDIEVGSSLKPTLTEWCHRYCASPRLLRVFRLRRVVTGFDEATLKQRLEGLVRSTNYRGHINITFPIEDKNVDIYTCNKINKWRLTTWIQWVFYLSFLWIFTWPFLFFATKRYAVVRAEWPWSMTDGSGRKVYTTVSEDQWFEKWQVAIRRLVLDQYQGEANEHMMTGVIARPADPPMPGSGLVTGHAGVDNAVGILTQGFQIARAVSNGDLGRGVQGGWGYDS